MIHFGLSAPRSGEGVLDLRADVGQLERVRRQDESEVVDVGGTVVALHLVRPLVLHPHTQRVQHRQYVRERHRLAEPEDLEVQVGVVLAPPEQVQQQFAGLVENLEHGEVLHRFVWAVRVLVDVGQRLAVAGDQRPPLVLAELALQRVGEVVVPEPGGVRDLGRESLSVDLAKALARVSADDEMDSAPGSCR